ncbi:TPA: prepilin-type cleavage/methylation domain-containing protein, partial [Neisseria meningitidis]
RADKAGTNNDEVTAATGNEEIDTKHLPSTCRDGSSAT